MVFFSLLNSCSPVELGIISAVVLPLLYALLFVGRRPKGCPPGPPTLPIIGNIHQLPKKDVHLAYQRWAEKYGPMFSLQLGQETVVVLADGYAVKAVMDKKSSVTSDRPKLYMQDVWEGSRIIMRGYDNLWKIERKLYHMFLNQSVAAKYIPYQSLETTKMLLDILDNPENFVDHIGRATSSLSTSMTYGFRIPELGNPIAEVMFQTAHGFFQLVITTQLFDWYPKFRALAKLLPFKLNPLAAKGTQIYHKESEHFRKLYLEAKTRGEMGDSLPCFALDIARAQETWKEADILTDHAASYIAGISFEAGADTTKNTLNGFIKAMVLFPEAQRLAQKEVDDVVGGDTLPGIEHYDRLPYIRGCVKEALRWMPTAITGAIPHSAQTDIFVDGHRIPKGATLSLAVWACNNDPKLFNDPRVFNPARHNVNLTVAQAAVADVKDRDMWTFGAGRRICPGLPVAERTLFLSIVRLVWTFNITPAKNSNGDPIEIDHDAVTQSIGACPMPYKCEITPRDKKRVDILEDEWNKIQEVLLPDGNYREYILRK